MEGRDSVVVAKRLAYLAFRNDFDCDTTKLQQLMYAAYGFYLVLYGQQGERLCDENPRCWENGPVFPKIRRRAEDIVDGALYATEKGIRIQPAGNDVGDAHDVDYALKLALRFLGEYSTNELANWACRRGSAWSIIRDAEGTGRYVEINAHIMRYEFEKLLTRAARNKTSVARNTRSV